MVAESGRMFPVPSDWPFETWEVAVTPLPLWLPVEGRRARLARRLLQLGY